MLRDCRRAEECGAEFPLCSIRISRLGELGGELAGHAGVARGNAACVVRNQSQFNAVVADVDVGVVLGLLGERGHAVDEGDRGDEVLELPFADQLAVRECPLG